MNWYSKSVDIVLKELSSSESGLSREAVSEQVKKYGPNSLPEEKVSSLFSIFLSQFKSPLVYILLLAALVVYLMGEMVDAAVIFAALAINAVVGTLQEGRAQAKLSALKRFAEGTAVVIRDGLETVLPDKALVPGDIIVLREGDKVPADARVIFSSSLKVDEAAITGESEAVLKVEEVIVSEGIGTADQRNMVFRGTLVVSGHARAVVVATGLSTIVGSIAVKLSTIDADMPIKRDIEYLSRVILLVVVIASIAIFIIGVLQGIFVREMFTTAIAVAVSAIPEGLPVVVTLVLATGVSRMSARNVLVKRLQAVEALGQARIVAVDKTGTITRNQMMVSSLYTGDKFFDITGNGYEPMGDFRLDGQRIEPLNHKDVIIAGRTAVVNAAASVAFSNEKKEWERVSGDPTEAALVVLGRKLGFDIDALEQENPKMAEIPFDSHLKYHATINMFDGKSVLSITGAPEVIVSRVEEVWREGKVHKAEKKDIESINAALKKLSRDGLRVLALAINAHGLKALSPDALPPLCFVGLVGIADVIRPEVFAAVTDTQRAGMKVVMITGDHADTAEAIGRKIGIFKDGDAVLLGSEIEALSPTELSRRLGTVSVFARVSPEHKLKIIEAYRARGEAIAMTGDGVNDALSLAAADLGVAMGKIGTEVAKEAADIVLLDDNFGSIVAAVEEGRNIYRTIQKVLLYLFSTSVGEVFAITLALALGYEVPLSPSQIIWLNFVTDGFLVIALALEPKEKDLLKARWKLTKGFFNIVSVERVILMGAVMMLGTIVFYDQYLVIAPEKAGTVALTILCVFQWFNAWNCRSESTSVFASRFKDNMFLVWGLAAVVLLQIAALHNGFLQKVLRTVPLSGVDWIAILAGGFLIVAVDELRKISYRARTRAKRA